MELSRRQFLSLAGMAGMAAMLPKFAFARDAASQQGDVLVVVFQRGAMDPLQAVPPWADNDYYRLRPTIAIPRPGSGSDAALPLDARFGLHPALAPLMPLYDGGEFAVVHATGFMHGSRSHFQCQDQLERAQLDGSSIRSGWLNRHLQTIGQGGEFQAVGFGIAQQKSLRGDAPALGMSSIEAFALTARSSRKTEIEDLIYGLYERESAVDLAARDALDTVELLAAANPMGYPIENGASYPATTFGRQLADVARLVKARVGLQVACVDINGWDHHDSINTRLPPLLDELARGLLAFRTDLGGRMANVTVVTMTEFGRRAYENASGGTDHGTGSLMFLLGGGVRGGQVYGDWPGLMDNQLMDGDLAITTDYRQVLAEMLEKRVGNAAMAEVFPGLPDMGRLGCFESLASTENGRIPLAPAT